MSKNAFLTGLLLLSIIGSIYLIRHLNLLTQHSLSLSRNVPDQFATQATYTNFNEEGKLHRQLMTIKGLQYQKQHTATFQHPYLIAYSTPTKLSGLKKPPWHVHADFGRSIQHAKIIELTGHVHLHQIGYAGHPETNITTTRLTIYPDKNIAKTSAMVHFVQPNNQINGHGMIANFQTEEIRLLNKAQAKHIPKPLEDISG